MDSTAQQRQDFSSALKRHLSDRSYADFAADVAAEAGERLSASAIGQYISGAAEPSRPKVYAMERVLGLAPGALSRLLGYLPVEAKAITSVPDAVNADQKIDAKYKHMLLVMYKEAVRSSG